jgi:hypothetical protein
LNTFVILFDDARIIDVVPMMEYFSWKSTVQEVFQQA